MGEPQDISEITGNEKNLLCKIKAIIKLECYNSYRDMFQDLPLPFSEDAYNGNKHVYLINNNRVRTKVGLVTPYHRPMALKGYKWSSWAVMNIGERVRLMHFIQEGDDTFYVTGYDRDGIEFGGYDGIHGRYSRFQSRVWAAVNRPQVLYFSYVNICFDYIIS